MSRMRDIALSRGLGIPCGLGKPVRLRLEDENLPIRFCGLVILQGGQPELRLPGVGMVDGLRVVAEGLHRETGRVAGRLGASGPGVAVGMQGHPLDPEPRAPLLELLGDNPLVLLQSDGALGLLFHPRPLALGDHGGEKPVHVEGEVVDAPQEHVGGDRPRVEGVEEILGRGLDQLARKNAAVGGILPRACCSTKYRPLVALLPSRVRGSSN